MVKLLFFSGYEWGNMGRRKVRLAYEFAQQDDIASVLYVNPPAPSSVFDLARGRFLSSHLGQDRRAHADALLRRSRQVEDKLWIYTGSTKTIPLTRSERLRRSTLLKKMNHWLYIAGLRHQLRRLPGDQLVIWLSYPLHAFALDAFPNRRLACYDWTDDWLQFALLPVADQTELERASERVLRQADLVFAVSKSLYQRAGQVNPNAHLAPNATDFALLSQSAETNLPVNPELQAIPRPRLGYIGQIGDKVDFRLIRAVAEARPNWSLVFVGPVWVTKQANVASLAHLNNVHFLGKRPYFDLPGFLRGFDVCLLPHLCNALTISMDPIKLYDYLASGKPIVGTPVAGLDRFADVLYVAKAHDEFVMSIETALSENDNKASKRLDYASQNSWPQRARQMWMTMRVMLEAQESNPESRGDR